LDFFLVCYLFSYAINKDQNINPLIVAPNTGAYIDELGGVVLARKIDVIGPTSKGATASMAATPTYQGLFYV
jgi:hypothetical protein